MFTAFFDVVSHNVAKSRWKGVNPPTTRNQNLDVQAHALLENNNNSIQFR
jgi:hypothetical protein